MTGISLPFVKNIIPLHCNVTTIIGPPMTVEKMNVSEESVEELQKLFFVALNELFCKYKPTCDPGAGDLVIV